ncbi:MAG: hypothetical protein KKE73_09140 [Proteobacteria bacterium]|nr:hypothetical protein [Pseudomonadota bacterium]
MSAIIKAVLLAVLCLSGTGVGGGTAQAHGLSYVPLDSMSTVAFEARFSSGEPVAYAEVLVFSPADAVVEFMNGRTDALGRFAFLPDVQGSWHVDVNAGLGHKLTFDVAVDQDGLNKVPDSLMKNSAPLWSKVLLGISLLLNLCWLGQTVKKPKGS